jgi:hypothetical protein
MAIEAQDGQSVKNTARDILLLAKKLNVGQQIVARSQSISDFAAYRELEAFARGIGCHAERHPALSNAAKRWAARCLGHGRCTGFASCRYGIEHPGIWWDSSSLLIQPDMASRMLSRVENLPDNSKKRPLVRQLAEGLQTTSSIMSESSSSLPPSAVQKSPQPCRPSQPLPGMRI